jgi:hypothetical protein
LEIIRALKFWDEDNQFSGAKGFKQASEQMMIATRIGLNQTGRRKKAYPFKPTPRFLRQIAVKSNENTFSYYKVIAQQTTNYELQTFPGNISS